MNMIQKSANPSDQKANRTMTRKPKRRAKIAGKKWLVRAPNGDLYVITQKTKPVRLERGSQKHKRVRAILEKAEKDLEKVIAEEIPILASGVTLAITEAFGHD